MPPIRPPHSPPTPRCGKACAPGRCCWRRFCLSFRSWAAAARRTTAAGHSRSPATSARPSRCRSTTLCAVSRPQSMWPHVKVSTVDPSAVRAPAYGAADRRPRELQHHVFSSDMASLAFAQRLPDPGIRCRCRPLRTQSRHGPGRRRGAEMVVGGYINHYMDGGSGGTSSLSLALEIYDARTGTLLWSMAQGGLMEARQVHDFYLFSIKERNPGDPAASSPAPWPGIWAARCWPGWIPTPCLPKPPCGTLYSAAALFEEQPPRPHPSSKNFSLTAPRRAYPAQGKFFLVQGGASACHARLCPSGAVACFCRDWCCAAPLIFLYILWCRFYDVQGLEDALYAPKNSVTPARNGCRPHPGGARRCRRRC